ncbi:MAG: VOC family protein [Pseudomonadota bacterium]
MSFSAAQAGAYLHHLAFESAAPARLATFYASAMDMAVRQTAGDEWRCEGPARRMIIKPGENKALAFAGLACRDAEAVESLKARADAAGVAIEASPSPYFEPGAFSVRDPLGHVICFGVSAPSEGPDGEQPRTPHGRLQGPTQHLTFAAKDVGPFVQFYHETLGFRLIDRVLHEDGSLATAFTTSNHEHHTIACFKSNRNGVDHHSYEAGDWTVIRDWCDHFAAQDIQLMWGPGRHGPGNNLFIFIEDPDGNWIEVSAELEVVHDRPCKDWPQHPRTLNLWGEAILRS